MQGQPKPSDLWGKFRPPERGGPAWHPLIDHSTDVACVLEALLAQPTIRHRLARAGGLADLDRVQVARLCFLAFLHDLGKCNWGFQRKIVTDVPRYEWAGHVGEVAALFLDETLSSRFCALLPLDLMASWVEEKALLHLLAAAISHHKRPLQLTSGEHGSIAWNQAHARLWQRQHGIDPWRGLGTLVEHARLIFMPAFGAAPPLPESPAFQHAFVGLLMLADWLGSDERFFPFSESLDADSDRAGFARQAAARSVEAVGLAVEMRRASLNAVGVSMRCANYYPLNAIQEAVLELPDPTAQLAVLEAETGSGKTEAALLHFKRLFEAGLVDGLYFALPTRSSASQIHKRVASFVGRLFPPDDRTSVIQAVPGYVKADDRMAERLPGFEVLWEDDPSEAERQKRWAAEHPKRYMAGQIVIGTIDQALLGTLQVPYAHLRSSALLRHLLIVDEVHSSDAYMTCVLQALLDTHLAAGGFVLLMSATLGAAARCAFLGEPLPPLATAEKVPYPALSAKGQPLRRIKGSRREKRVAIERLPLIAAPEPIAERAITAACAGAKVLVVRNTVGDAVALCEVVRARLRELGRLDLLLTVEGAATLHHGRFAPDDRKLLDAEVERRLGRTARPAGGAVVIGTQTLEQSLDIDADLLVTDLAPMDVLLQRIGRLHRHPRHDRPQGFGEPRCLVLVPEERDLAPFITSRAHGLGSVYRDLRGIEATLRLLQQHDVVAIPAVNRYLVERVTHTSVLDAIADEGGAAWREHAQSILGTEFAEKGMAGLHVLNRLLPFGTFALASVEEKVTTRLGADDRVIDLISKGEVPPLGPFGLPVTTLKMPGRFVKGVPGDANVRNITANPAGFTFLFGDQSLIYDAMGLRPTPTP